MSGEISSVSKAIKKFGPIFFVGIAVLALSVWLYGPHFVVAMILGVLTFFVVGLALKPMEGKDKNPQI